MNMKNLLDNNSNEMKTVVETFVIEETSSLIYDNEQLDNWNKMVEDLGLTGQTSIQVKEKSPIPFMHLKSNLVVVLETICPRKVDVRAFNISPIPLEILDLIALSKREKYFDEVQIWYDDKSPDPVCIGLKNTLYSYLYDDENKKSYTRHDGLTLSEQAEHKNSPLIYFSGSEIMGHYLLGKWGDVKRSFAELTQMATARYTQEKSHEYKKIIKDYERKLTDIEQEAFDKFGSDIHNSDALPF
jgi:hypothetical protein